MRILVTGATGFVGRWLLEELRANGHEAVASPGSHEVEITDFSQVTTLVRRVHPDAIAHLAGVAFAGDAAREPARALEVNADGTRTVVSVAGAAGGIPVLVSGSAEVYGYPDPGDLPLRESAPLRGNRPYAISKVAQERLALEVGRNNGVPLVVTRSFNQIGPGQRPEFVAPAMARRLIRAKAEGNPSISVGNLDVRRDFTDVRDVVRAYRLLIERIAGGTIRTQVVNVGSGMAIAVRELLERLGQIVGITPDPVIDPALVRAGEPELIVGDTTRLRDLTGWTPEIPLALTLQDLVRSIEEGESS